MQLLLLAGCGCSWLAAAAAAGCGSGIGSLPRPLHSFANMPLDFLSSSFWPKLASFRIVPASLFRGSMSITLFRWRWASAKFLRPSSACESRKMP